MVKTMKIIAFALAIPLVFGHGAVAEESPERLNSIEAGPDFDIFFLQFARKLTSYDEVVLAAIYMDSGLFNMVKYPGTMRIIGGEAGYRRYLIGNFHVEAALLPQYVICDDSGTGTRTAGMGLASELRLGYQFDFVPFYLNLQFFAGYHLVNPRPENFIATGGTGSFYWSPIPMFLFGLRI